MVIDGNIYITFAKPDADTAEPDAPDAGAAAPQPPAGRYLLQQGRRREHLDRFARAEHHDFREAWDALCAGTVALRHGRVEAAECHALDPRHRVYSIAARNRHGDPVRLAIFTEIHTRAATGEPTGESVIRVGVASRQDHLHFDTANPDDLRVVAEAFRASAALFRG